MTNFDLSQHIFRFLKQAGVKTLVVCAGARNVPLVNALENENFEVFSFFEERSAAFFALGLIKAYETPVAVLTTSGTASAELLPAAIEATYQGLPLVLITSDRPKSYRGTGSPQTIEQPGLFMNYVESAYDFDVNTKDFHFKWAYKKPIHLNVCFDEPLIDKSENVSLNIKIESKLYEHPPALTKFVSARPLIIVGDIDGRYQERVVKFIKATGAPVYAESMSLLKNNPDLSAYLVKSSDNFVKEIFKLELCDSVIRIGGVPTLRFWRDLEKEYNDVPVLNYTNLPYSGLSRPSIMIEMDMLNAFEQYPADVLALVRKMDKKLQAEKIKLFKKFPLSEQALTHELSGYVKEEALYLGNSLPIRHWDQFAECRSNFVYANRGANGIDGQISSYLGWSQNKDISYCFIGDLTALYDLSSLGLTPQLKPNKRFIVVMNNFGGQIFKRLFKNDKFINAHGTQFYHWAKMWDWSYTQVAQVEDLKKINSFNTPNVIVEVVPDAKQTETFWEEWDFLCQSV